MIKLPQEPRMNTDSQKVNCEARETPLGDELKAKRDVLLILGAIKTLSQRDAFPIRVHSCPSVVQAYA